MTTTTRTTAIRDTRSAERVRQFAALIGQLVPGRTPTMLEAAR